MKRNTTFQLDPHIRPTLKVMAKKKGVDLDFLVNEILLIAIGTNTQPTSTAFSVFAESIPLNERNDKKECIEIFESEHPEMQGVSGKMITNWLKEYAANNGCKYLSGRNGDNGWFALNEIGVSLVSKEKKTLKDSFTSFADQIKMSLTPNCDKKIIYDSFCDQFPSAKKLLSQKVLMVWINEYASSLGYKCVWAGGRYFSFTL